MFFIKEIKMKYIKEPKIPPYSNEAEKAILGSVLKNPDNFKRIKDYGFNYLKMYVDIHIVLFINLYALWKDENSREQILEKMSKDPDLCYPIISEYFDHLESYAEKDTNLESYMGIVKERSLLRELISDSDTNLTDPITDKEEVKGMLDDLISLCEKMKKDF